MTETQRQELEALRKRLRMRVDPNPAQTINNRAHEAYHRHNGADAPCSRKH